MKGKNMDKRKRVKEIRDELESIFKSIYPLNEVHEDAYRVITRLDLWLETTENEKGLFDEEDLVIVPQNGINIEVDRTYILCGENCGGYDVGDKVKIVMQVLGDYKCEKGLWWTPVGKYYGGRKNTWLEEMF